MSHLPDERGHGSGRDPGMGVPLASGDFQNDLEMKHICNVS